VEHGSEARVERIPSFIRPMAKKAIERFAEAQGIPSITEAVMDEARGALGMYVTRVHLVNRMAPGGRMVQGRHRARAPRDGREHSRLPEAR
jgi:hypothetical protein